MLGGSGDHFIGHFHFIAELAALGGHGAHGDAGIFGVDLGDLVLGDAVDKAQEGGNHQGDDRKSTGDLEDKLTGNLHYFAASFFSFFSAP